MSAPLSKSAARNILVEMIIRSVDDRRATLTKERGHATVSGNEVLVHLDLIKALIDHSRSAAKLTRLDHGVGAEVTYSLVTAGMNAAILGFHIVDDLLSMCPDDTARGSLIEILGRSKIITLAGASLPGGGPAGDD